MSNAPNFTRCRSCKADIFYATTRTGSLMPFDKLPIASGSFFVVNGRAEHVDANTDLAAKCRSKDAQRYTSHFVTCPNRDQHRKGKGKGNG